MFKSFLGLKKKSKTKNIYFIIYCHTITLNDLDLVTVNNIDIIYAHSKRIFFFWL